MTNYTRKEASTIILLNFGALFEPWDDRGSKVMARRMHLLRYKWSKMKLHMRLIANLIVVRHC